MCVTVVYDDRLAVFHCKVKLAVEDFFLYISRRFVVMVIQSDLADADVADFEEIPFTLEDYFMQFYREDRQFGEVR